MLGVWLLRGKTKLKKNCVEWEHHKRKCVLRTEWVRLLRCGLQGSEASRIEGGGQKVPCWTHKQSPPKASWFNRLARLPVHERLIHERDKKWACWIVPQPCQKWE